MAAAMCLELALFSCWKDRKLEEDQRGMKRKETLQAAVAMPKGIGIALPTVRSAFVKTLTCRLWGMRTQIMPARRVCVLAFKIFYTPSSLFLDIQDIRLIITIP